MMKLLGLAAVLGLVSGALTGQVDPPVYDHTTHPEWLAWKQTHEKRYVSVDEEVRRFGIFLETVAKNEAHNARYEAGLETYYTRLNQFSDMTMSEWAAWVGSGIDMNQVQRELAELGPEQLHTNVTAGLSDVNWKGKCTAPRQQLPCYSCWAFATVAAVEAAVAIKHNTAPVDLSPQNLVDCCNVPCDNKSGTSPQVAMQKIIDEGGIATDKAYPWTKGKPPTSTCQFNKNNVGARVTAIKRVTNEAALENAVNSQPVVVVIQASQDLKNYGGGFIFNSTTCKGSGNLGNHGFTVVGYGSTPIKHWIIKNSWGPGWGEQGYVRYKKGDALCGIGNDGTYPIVA